ncbi:MAG: glycerophosphoryl diester phosphodiesterase membrane domain-containing protein [Lachnospiraceae bacterium]|nr:glycerophosphoryl diester phosphodiesterase membrane domain-containing protein [Lachnospiraceae bacterium]
MSKEKQTETEQKNVSYARLVYEALPEMWSFHFVSGIILTVITRLITWLMTEVAETAGGAATTANIKTVLFSWRGPVMLVLDIILVLAYIAVEILAQIYLTDDILKGRTSGIRRELGMGFKALRHFCTPTGVLVVIFIIFAVPLVGVGFSISLTKSFYVPNFIMDVVYANRLYALAYVAVIILLVWVIFRYCFILHAMLLEGKSSAEARSESSAIVKAHGGRIIASLIGTCLLLFVFCLAAYMLFCYLPGMLVQRMGQDLPHDRVIDYISVLTTDSGTELDYRIMAYRILSAFVLLVGGLIFMSVTFLCGAYLMLRFTRIYLEHSGNGPAEFLERPKKSHYRGKVIFMFTMIALMAVLAFFLGAGYNEIFDKEEPVRIVAHRTGGKLESENSLEGLYAAIEHGCYGSETDVQRTKDGFYVINHDNDFKRLTGVAKAPKNMTMDEIKELRIRDTTGSGRLLPVVTIEEMLDVIKDKEKLFIELKGSTADRQMADDIVRIVRNKDCVDDVVLISLNYDVIDYAETNYPEFETGTLFFAGVGNVAKLNCDLLIMEEEMSTDDRIRQIHNAGKQAIVWTVNTEKSMRKFLDSDVDGVITDEIELAERVQKELDERTEYEVFEDKLEDLWE